VSAQLDRPLARALVDALDDQALDALADLLAPRLQSRLGQQDEWLDTGGAAAHLGVGVSTIHRLAKAGRVPAHQDVPAGKYAFLRSELDAWRAGQ
jgi:excisionase family DNA binding protein